MTLATQIAVTGPVPIDKLYDLVDGMVRPVGKATSDRTWEPGVIHNRIGQGNASMLDIEFSIDGEMFDVVPLHAAYKEELAADEIVWDDVWEGWHPPVDFYAKIRLDTSYGWEGPVGETCSVLHASIVVAAHQFAAEHGAGVVWRNEYTGRWHPGVDGIAEFIGDGDAAMAWFTGTVQPVVEAEAAVNGGQVAWH